MKPTKKLNFNKGWKFKPVEDFSLDYLDYIYDDKEWLEVDLPFQWQTRPEFETYSGKGVFRKVFEFSADPEKFYRLRFYGIFYWANIFLNGEIIHKQEGYFERFDVHITGKLLKFNCLVVEVDCPFEKDLLKKEMIMGIFAHWDCKDPLANPGGIWGDIELIESECVYLSEYRFTTLDIKDGKARVEAFFGLQKFPFFPTYAGKKRDISKVKLIAEFNVVDFPEELTAITSEMEIHNGFNGKNILFFIENPKLWWCHDQGIPHRYRAVYKIIADDEIIDQVEFYTGIRMIKMHKWQLYLNDRRIFVKGTNYAPTDFYLSRVTPQQVKEDMLKVLSANMNMVRVHAHIAKEIYSICDELGIMVWQDFPLHWFFNVKILKEARRQVSIMIRQLYNHPSIVLWNIHNEPIKLVETDDKSFKAVWRLLTSTFLFNINKDFLCVALKMEALLNDVSRPINRASGLFPRPFGGTDTHYYFGWYYSDLKTFDRLIDRLPSSVKFVTEFGSQSFPDKESLSKWVKGAALYEVDFNGLVKRGMLQKKIMEERIPQAERKYMLSFIHASQKYQAFLNKFYIERLRLKKYKPTGGVLQFMLTDCCPGVSWSIIDYYRREKLAYQAVKDSFAPLQVMVKIKPEPYQAGLRELIPIYIVNDKVDISGQAQVKAEIKFNGKTIADYETIAFINPDMLPVKIGDINFKPDEKGEYVIQTSLNFQNSLVENSYLISVK